MAAKVTWASFGVWSGPRIRGTVPYIRAGCPTGFDVIAAATAVPEGGSYNTVVMYDGTAVTYGLFQWTFTSGRLHKLLAVTAGEMGLAKYNALIGNQLCALTGLELDASNEELYLDKKRVTDFFKLRDVCTPPGGKVPRAGKNWELARKIALLFSKLGEDPIAQSAQMSFFKEELRGEAGFRRPQLGGMKIAEYLPPRGWDAPVVKEEHIRIAAQALFWSSWQNAPRQAEKCLSIALRGFDLPLSSPAGLDRLARKIGFSPFGRWGVTKARNAVGPDGKPKPYTSRYEKMASEINKMLKGKILPELWKR